MQDAGLRKVQDRETNPKCQQAGGNQKPRVSPTEATTGLLVKGVVWKEMNGLKLEELQIEDIG